MREKKLSVEDFFFLRFSPLSQSQQKKTLSSAFSPGLPPAGAAAFATAATVRACSERELSRGSTRARTASQESARFKTKEARQDKAQWLCSTPPLPSPTTTTATWTPRSRPSRRDWACPRRLRSRGTSGSAVQQQKRRRQPSKVSFFFQFLRSGSCLWPVFDCCGLHACLIARARKRVVSPKATVVPSAI